MKKIMGFAFLSLFCAMLTGCGKNEPLSIVVATDLHYLSPSLTDYGTGFMRMVENGDGKLTQYSPEIMEVFFQEVSELHPDALILSGDLAFNGERESHAELAGRLERLQEEGISVLILPGNHDLNYPFAASFEGESVARTSSVTAEEFAEIYGKLGYREAASRDGESLSFLYKMTDRLWIILLDSNTEKAAGRLKEGTLSWLEAHLKSAKESGAAVITVTHQNVLIQNGLLSKGFVMENHEETAELLRKYGVELNLSGHVHIQHISEENGLSDIATSSLSVYPNQYGFVELDADGTISYETRRLALKMWKEGNAEISEKAWIERNSELAERRESTQKAETSNNTCFADMSREFFDNCTRRKLEKELGMLPVSPEEKDRMMELAVMMNHDYFAGTVKKSGEITDTEAWKLWEMKGKELFFKRYMDSMMEDEGKEENRLVIEP